MSKITALLLFTLVAATSIAQQPVAKSSNIYRWHSHAVPSDSATLYAYGWSDSVWSVYKTNDSVYVLNTFHPADRERVPAESIPRAVANGLLRNEKLDFHQSKNIIRVDDGYLIGINRGEWGGRIVWYSNDGKQHYKISNDQVIQFIRKNGEIFAVQGLDHMGVSQGSLIKMLKWNKKWESYTYHTLPYAPIGIDTDSKGHFVIATSNSLLEIDDNEKYITLLDNAFWDLYGYLYPDSLIVEDDKVYIGMRKGVFKFDLKTKKQEWLMPD